MHKSTPIHVTPIAGMATSLAQSDVDLGCEHSCILHLNRDGFLARDIDAGIEAAIERARGIRADCHGIAGWLIDAAAALFFCICFAAVIAFWRSDAKGRACNGGSNTPVTPGTIETIPGQLEICTRNGLHATLLPPKWEGPRWWIVALSGEVQWEDDKCAALTREILGEAL